LAEKHGLERVDRQTFKDYFDKHSANGDGRSLLRTMKALERYGLSSSSSEEQSNNDSQYAHAKRYIDNANMEHQADSIKYCILGTEPEPEFFSFCYPEPQGSTIQLSTYYNQEISYDDYQTKECLGKYLCDETFPDFVANVATILDTMKDNQK
ncbi:unnamed protein product, partial [Adineta steineri]